MADEYPVPRVVISPFEPDDENDVLALILAIQQAEFGFAIGADDQPDLRAVPKFYQTGAGGFWVARCEERIVGTIGLKDIGNSEAALRKMFVMAPYRGPELSVASRLLVTLLGHASCRGLSKIYLGTTDKFRAAHRFYEKNGFIEVPKANLPTAFPLMAVDTKFYAIGVPPR